jgi:F-type H+-transporting ATPase subunit epsilon
MQLRIYSLKGVIFDGQCTSLNLKTESGEITILNNHSPLISVLKEGIIYITKNDSEIQEIRIKNGFLDVKPQNNVDILVD